MWLLIDAYRPDMLGELKPHFIERKFFERSNNILIHTQQFTVDYKILSNIINIVLEAAHNNQSGLKGQGSHTLVVTLRLCDYIVETGITNAYKAVHLHKTQNKL